MTGSLTLAGVRERFGDVPTNHTERSFEPAEYDAVLDRVDRPWGVGGLVWTAERVALVYEDAVWKAPGGRLERGESPTAGARREIREETGLSVRIDGLAAIDRLRHTNTATGESFDFHFLMFDCTPETTTLAVTPGLDDEAIESAQWHETLPADTFRRDLLATLLTDRWSNDR